MFKQINDPIVIALCTACAMIAFAWSQKHEPAIHISAVLLYLAAAFIALLPVFYAFLRRKPCQPRG